MRTHGSSLRHDPVSMSQARRAFAARPFAALIATGFGAGLSPVAPGTAGSLVGLAAAWFLASHGSIVGSPVGLLMSGLAVAAAGVPISTRACRGLGAKDPGCVVIDEVAGQLLSSSPVPLFLYPSRAASAGLWLFSFLAFRFFDIVKPGVVRRIQALPEGLGVVVDDVLAGFLAAGATAVVGWIVSGGRPWS